MRLLIVSSVTPIKGGVSSWVNTIGDKLKTMGYTVKIISAAGESTTSFTVLPANYMKMISRFLNNDLIFFITFLLAKEIVKIRVLLELRHNKYDLVHAQDVSSLNAIYSYCRKKRIKLVLTVHGHLYNGGTATRKINGNTWINHMMYQAEKEAYTNADHIITVSDYSYNFVSSISGASKVSLIRNFVNTEVFYAFDQVRKEKLREKFKYKKEDFILIFAGRLVKEKGVIHILEGIKGAITHLSGVKLIVCGDGPEKTALMEYVRSNRLKDRVLFTGEIHKEELVDLYNIADAYIIATITSEGTSMSLLEAMACGLPVLATSVRGIIDIMTHRVNALLFKEEDGQAITEAIKLLSEDGKLRENIANKVLEEVKKIYSLDIVIEKIINIYKNIA